MKRFIESDLLAWKNDLDRKALLVRGARQVGKTYSIRELGKTFNHFVEVNFEEDRDVGVFFRDSLGPAKICEKLSAYYSTPIIDGETLLFFDEFQADPLLLASGDTGKQCRGGLCDSAGDRDRIDRGEGRH